MASVDAHNTPSTADPDYALSSSSEDEHERLSRQSRLHEQFTRKLFVNAGIGPGMRVLDVGCGPGDVSFLVREMVGADGLVVGVERDEQAVATARRRAVAAGVENVEFLCGDFREIEIDGEPFDALVGRFVLMYQADPADAVMRAAGHVRPGGVVAFAEINMPVGSAVPERAYANWPPTPASEQVNKWVYEAFAKLGTQPDMGTRLLETFTQAGLEPSPDLETEFAVVVGEEAISHTVEFLSSLLPAILGAGIATEEEIDIDTLPERLRAGTSSAGRVRGWPPGIGAFATKPSGA
ncbi:MAG TPA: methyltransferase domain-containing protein [Solirubrobacteraceae bacterium]|jgi:ubiquinone/menaquinone biosynthesis C-methylase UbiE|nr:methyltransferase domain-containing protein [Solirubrobacteraceae bacterium]